MPGQLEMQEDLFYRFRIDEPVPHDHFLRRIDRWLDFGANRKELAALYSHTVRQSVDPERALLIGQELASNPIEVTQPQTNRARDIVIQTCAGLASGIHAKHRCLPRFRSGQVSAFRLADPACVP